MRKKIMQLQSGSGYSGGIANYVSTLIKTKAFDKHSNYVITPGSSAISSKIKNNFYPNASLYDLPQSYSFLSFIPYLISLYKILREEQIEILHSHALRSGFVAAVMSFFLDIRVVYTTHGLRYSQKNGIGRAISFLIESIVLMRSDHVVVIRKSDFNLLVKMFNRVERKVSFIPTRLAKIADFSPKKYNGGKLRVVSVGSLIELKRPEKFISWVQELSNHGVDVSATWVGDGPLMSSVQTLSKIKELSILFPGQLSTNEVARQIEKAHFLFVTSEYEVMPLAVIESYSCGLPVIVNYFRGVEDFVEDGVTGLVIGEKENFADLLVALVSNPKRFEKMSIEANKKFEVEFCDPEVMGDQYNSIYDRL